MDRKYTVQKDENNLRAIVVLIRIKYSNEDEK
jgi:hypothetical protein